MNTEKKRFSLSWLKWPSKLPLLAALVVLIALIAAAVMFRLGGSRENEAEITVVSTLEKIVNVSDLSTFTAVYNGIAEVTDEKHPDKVDYYVSYEAQVEAGIDFADLEISLKDGVITVDLPDVKINNISVDISSLDFLFFDNGANTLAVSEQAYKACEEDARRESENQDAILELAQQNAENVVKALVKPIVDQMDEGYELVVE